MGSVSLHRVGGLGRATSILVGIAALLALASVLAQQSAKTDAEALLADEISTEEFVEQTLPYLLTSLLQGVAVLASAVITIIWMYRVAANHRALHRGTTWGPGWAIGGWFAPPLLYVIPFLMLREMWKASDPDVKVGNDWKSGSASPLIAVWFVLYSVVPIVLLFVSSAAGLSSFGASERDLAEQITSDQSSTFVAAAVTLAGAAAFIGVARGITGRHQRLTGEVGG
jgi:hypothetical protein